MRPAETWMTGGQPVRSISRRNVATDRRSDLFEKRRELMVDWASFVISGPGASER